MLKKLRAIFTFTGIILLLGAIFTDEWASVGERVSYAVMSICMIAVCQPSAFIHFFQWLLKIVASAFDETNSTKLGESQVSGKISARPQSDISPQKRLNAKQMVKKAMRKAASSAHSNNLEPEHPKPSHNCQERSTAEQAIKKTEGYEIPVVSVTNEEENTCKAKFNEEFAKYGGTQAELLTIDLMSDAEFKKWCADFLSKSGFSNIEVPVGGSKNGVDLTADYGWCRYAIHCNHSKSDLGRTSIQKVFAGKYLFQCTGGIVIANRYFKDTARELARENGTVLLDREDIEAYLNGDGIRVMLNDGISNQSSDIAETEIITSREELQKFEAAHPLINDFYTKVVGVSYRNDDGSSRQKLLSRCKNGDEVLFQPFKYDGAPAVAVFTQHGQIGNLSVDLATSLEVDYDCDLILSGTISEVTGGYDGLSYGCNLHIMVYKA